ncbi:hypothetical protein C5167_042159 [Papaver somniferum]|nr:hypothetical protein C5167_042159 [Papaver somniferum]
MVLVNQSLCSPTLRINHFVLLP